MQSTRGFIPAGPSPESAAELKGTTDAVHGTSGNGNDSGTGSHASPVVCSVRAASSIVSGDSANDNGTVTVVHPRPPPKRRPDGGDSASEDQNGVSHRLSTGADSIGAGTVAAKIEFGDASPGSGAGVAAAPASGGLAWGNGVAAGCGDTRNGHGDGCQSRDSSAQAANNKRCDLGKKDLATLQTTSYSNTGWLSHLWIFLKRATVQATRAFWPVTVLEVVLLLGAAAAVGASQGNKWGPTAVPGNIVMAMMCLAVLAVVQHLRAFIANRLVLRRERGAGLSPTAYFTARCMVDLPWILAAPAIFTLPYYILTVPHASFVSYYAISVGVWWWASGFSYLLSDSPFVPAAAAPTAAVLTTLIAGGLLNGFGTPSLSVARGTPAGALLGLSYNRWALEGLTVSELDHYMATHRNVIAAMYREKGICGMDRDFRGDLLQPDGDMSGDTALTLMRLTTNFTRGYCHRVFKDALVALLCLGLGLRLLAMLTHKYDTVILQSRDTVVYWWRTLAGHGGAGAGMAAEGDDARAGAAASGTSSASGAFATAGSEAEKGEVYILMDTGSSGSAEPSVCPSIGIPAVAWTSGTQSETLFCPPQYRDLK
ncbi:hypothetical protein VOLCADRAFT_93890 [Volvox carteri f. nagariensis]|uniref:ABC transporter family G domain-containing protein n=1 Tax=Volvox carteri f. nagariensis TaxID=3068 RepID=D8U3C2_VOLCA|nr:uncharacterized protein VOLCADRAFT_93890 [Volvox carteri f. nagariensis]EFJ45800.1 hypothetical protein VOLCADRAFT_93890 [Volvox carteri f. nagariensis]|eukprot:XP_002953201.1 hypothetical protein VOLCADRAFT_93890 [Volvox carteri f. nagariensis]